MAMTSIPALHDTKYDPARLGKGTRLATVLAVLFFLLASCRPVHYPQSLQVADSLCAAHPQRALEWLDSLRPRMEQERKGVRMYYDLLCIKAQDKAYMPHTSDSLIQAVLHYYEERADRRHLPEAYYYAGRVASDLGDAPQALDYFGKALEAMPEGAMTDLRNKVLAQMGTLFYRQKMYPEALEKYRQSLACDSLLGDSLGMVFSLRDIGQAYIGLGKQDSTLFYLLQANRICDAVQNSTVAYSIQNSIAGIYAEKNELGLAEFFLKKAMQTVPERRKSAIHFTAGMLCQMQNRLDSAAWHYEEAIRRGSVHTQWAAYGNLSQIVLAQGNPDAAIRYLKLRNACADSIQRITNTEGIRQMNALHNYQLREKENNRLKEANARRRQSMVYLSLGMAALLIGGWAFYRKRRKEWKNRWEAAETLKEEAYRRSDRFIQANQAEMARLQEKIRQLQDKLENTASVQEELERQKTQLKCANQKALLEQSKRKVSEEQFFASTVYEHFKELLTREKPRVVYQDWKDLQVRLDECYDGFTHKLEAIHKMSEREMQICLLLKAGFSKTEIAKLIHLSLEGISSVRRRLYAKVFNDKGGAKDWDLFISSL